MLKNYLTMKVSLSPFQTMLSFVAITVLLTGCVEKEVPKTRKSSPPASSLRASFQGPEIGSVKLSDVNHSEFVAALEHLEDHNIRYNPSYVQLSFPDGDVPAHTGVCIDVVLRAFMQVGVSLQQEVHMFRKQCGLNLDHNIDHRRVRNVGPYLASKGLEIDADGLADGDFEAGDIIWWKLSWPHGLDHIGIVMPNGKVLHNIGHGQCSDALPNQYNVHRVYRLPAVGDAP